MRYAPPFLSTSSSNLVLSFFCRRPSQILRRSSWMTVKEERVVELEHTVSLEYSSHIELTYMSSSRNKRN